MTSSSPLNHFLTIKNSNKDLLQKLIKAAHLLKREDHQQWARTLLEHKILALIFESPSTRTRVSFDVGMRQLGGQTLMLSEREMQLGRGETISDTAKVLSRYVDGIMIRILSHDALEDLAKNASVPVINGLTRLEHPCQLMADLLTYEEKRGSIRGKKIAWVGDWNNVVASWAEASRFFDFELHIATPPEYSPPADNIKALKARGAHIHCTHDAVKAVANADLVMTDTWVSMGDKDKEQRMRHLAPYQVNQSLMAHADQHALFMHCLPAHRGDEVSAEIMDGAQSVVFDEAENRLHAQKAILCWVFNKLDDVLALEGCM